MRLRETGQTVVEIAIGRLAEADSVAVVFQVPASVWLRSPVSLVPASDPDADSLLEASYFRCAPQACFADAPLTEDLKTLLMGGSELLVSFEDATRRELRLPVSLDGFADAFAATFPAAASGP